MSMMMKLKLGTRLWLGSTMYVVDAIDSKLERVKVTRLSHSLLHEYYFNLLAVLESCPSIQSKVKEAFNDLPNGLTLDDLFYKRNESFWSSYGCFKADGFTDQEGIPYEIGETGE